MTQFKKVNIYFQNVGIGSDLLSDDEDESTENTIMFKQKTRETARLLPSSANRSDSFESELDESAI